MLTDEIIEEFFNAIDDADNNNVSSLLSRHPSIVLSNPYDDKLPFQEANAAVITTENRIKIDPTPGKQKLIKDRKLVKKIIHDATVLYALDNNDTNLMQYMYDNQSSPYITLSNGIDPLKYAIENGKTEAENWIRNQFKKGSEQFKALGPTPFSNLFGLTEEKKQQIEELKMQRDAELLALSGKTIDKVATTGVKPSEPEPTKTVFSQPNNGALFSDGRLEEQRIIQELQRDMARIDAQTSAIDSLLAATKK